MLVDTTIDFDVADSVIEVAPISVSIKAATIVASVEVFFIDNNVSNVVQGELWH